MNLPHSYIESTTSCCLVVVFAAKPVGNLPLRVFQRYFARMADAVRECPGAVANELFSKRLIARETLERVQSTLGLAPHDKASILLMAVEPMVAGSKGEKVLRKLCGILASKANVTELPKRMMAKYGKFY